MPKLFSDPSAIAEDIIRDVGTQLVVGLPLGLGKANHIINALYARAAADRSISLTFLSALTLEKNRSRRTCWNGVSLRPSSTACSAVTRIWPMPTRCMRERCRPISG